MRRAAGPRLSGRPDVVVACVGGGSNAAGTFAGFADTPARLVGVEAAGGAAISHGRPGVLHGFFLAPVLQDEHGQVIEAESVSAGLDYPGVGPEHADLAASGRAEYHTVTDEEAIAAVELCAGLRESWPRWTPRTWLPGWPAPPAAASWPPGPASWSPCPGAATRTPPP